MKNSIFAEMFFKLKWTRSEAKNDEKQNQTQIKLLLTQDHGLTTTKVMKTEELVLC